MSKERMEYEEAFRQALSELTVEAVDRLVRASDRLSEARAGRRNLWDTQNS